MQKRDPAWLSVLFVKNKVGQLTVQLKWIQTHKHYMGKTNTKQ